MSEDQLNRLFVILDGSGNGFVERSDLLSYSEKAGGAVTEKATELWSLLSPLDTDNDGRISKPEFVVGVDFDAVVEAAVAMNVASMDAVDTDQDGKVSREEWATINDTLGISREDSDAGFDALDTDKDGLISREEFTARVLELYNGDEDLSKFTVVRP